MQFNQKRMMMMNFAVIAVMMSVMIMGTYGQSKPIECCERVSTDKITLPITGYKLQFRNPPCVYAVIFYTADGKMWCTFRKADWVRQKIRELKKLQRGDMKMNSTVSRSLSTTSS